MARTSRRQRKQSNQPQSRQNDQEARIIKQAAAKTAELTAERTVEEIREEVQFWKGPLPHPQTLKEFEETIPGSGQAIVNAFVNQNQHRIKIESLVVHNNVQSEKRGQWMAFILALLFIGLGAALVFTGRDVGGYATIGTTGAALVGAFAVARRRAVAEQSRKRRDDRQN